MSSELILLYRLAKAVHIAYPFLAYVAGDSACQELDSEITELELALQDAEDLLDELGLYLDDWKN